MPVRKKRPPRESAVLSYMLSWQGKGWRRFYNDNHRKPLPEEEPPACNESFRDCRLVSEEPPGAKVMKAAAPAARIVLILMALRAKGYIIVDPAVVFIFYTPL